LKPSTNEQEVKTHSVRRTFGRFCGFASSTLQEKFSGNAGNRHSPLHCCNTRPAIHISAHPGRLYFVSQKIKINLKQGIGG
jgi:hypothetical protein